MINNLINLNINEQLFIKGFRHIKPELLRLYESYKHEEDFHGESEKVYTMLDLIYINIFMTIVRLKYEELKSFEDTDAHYNFRELKKCFACKGINFDILLDIYQIKDNDTEQGISTLEIDETFKIGSDHIEADFGSYDISELIENLNSKTCEINLIGIRRVIQVDDSNRALSTDGTTTLIEI